jgi:aspartyl-tRNA synthetase
MLRTHTCGELRKEHAGKIVKLAGWVETHRVQGKLSFLILRDKYGKTQFFVNPELTKEIGELRRETVLQIEGEVKVRPENQIKKEQATGEIEVSATKITVLSASEPLPFDAQTATEETRMQYRYLDLRSERMQRNLQLRHVAAQATRKQLSDEGFVEVETPLLMRSTPEGARDFLVPSRVNKGKFYALPQNPQIYKQLLMVSGVDKYFQLSKCMRDEDLRADRQPEFTQIDVEMSFPELKDIYALGDRLLQAVVKESVGKEIKLPIPRIPYAEAVERWGLDKPDIRFGLELVTVTDLVKDSEFKVFSSAEAVRAIVVDKDFSKKEIEKLTKLAQVYKAKGLAFLTHRTLQGPISKFLGDEEKENLSKFLGIKDNQTVFFVADKPEVCNEALGHIRNQLGKDLQLYDPSELAFCWVTEFPLFEFDEELNDWTAAHHMFTMPTPETIEFLESDPGKVIASCYDIVLNGVELASGSIRVSDPEVQKRVMKAMNIDEQEAEEKFGFFLEALTYGAPPHGGFAIGFDRMVALLGGDTDIRDYIAFPKNKAMQGPMDKSPSSVDSEQLDELGLSLKK